MSCAARTMYNQEGSPAPKAFAWWMPNSFIPSAFCFKDLWPPALLVLNDVEFVGTWQLQNSLQPSSPAISYLTLVNDSQPPAARTTESIDRQRLAVGNECLARVSRRRRERGFDLPFVQSKSGEKSTPPCDRGSSR